MVGQDKSFKKEKLKEEECGEFLSAAWVFIEAGQGAQGLQDGDPDWCHFPQ